MAHGLLASPPTVRSSARWAKGACVLGLSEVTGFEFLSREKRERPEVRTSPRADPDRTPRAAITRPHSPHRIMLLFSLLSRIHMRLLLFAVHDLPAQDPVPDPE
jgi:hypothetical protein